MANGRFSQVIARKNGEQMTFGQAKMETSVSTLGAICARDVLKTQGAIWFRPKMGPVQARFD